MPASKTAQIACVFIILALAALSDASIGERPSTEQAVRIDGVLDEEAWQDALQIDINIETKPGENIAARVNCVISVLPFDKQPGLKSRNSFPQI